MGKMKKYQIVTSIILTSMLPISWVFLHFGASPETVFNKYTRHHYIGKIFSNTIFKDTFQDNQTNNLIYYKFTFFLMILISFPVMIEIEYILQLWLGDNIPENTVKLIPKTVSGDAPKCRNTHEIGNIEVRIMLVTI